MSDEREMTKPGEPDFQAHQLKEETIEPEPEAGTEVEEDTEVDDFEAHQLKPGGVADQLKNQLKN
jgi:hypothetical protein